MSQQPFDPSKLDIDFTSGDTPQLPPETPAPQIDVPQESVPTQEPVSPPSPATSQPKEEADFFDQSDAIDIETLSTILTDESLVPEEVKQHRAQLSPESSTQPSTQNIVFDINIKTVEDIADILLRNSYDFAVFMPEISSVKIVFKKGGILKETRFIEYGVYMQLLITAKTIIGTDVRITSQEQQGIGHIVLRNKNIQITGKTTPTETGSGEILYIKAAISTEKKKVPKKKAGSSFSAKQAFGFLGVLLLFGLIV